MPQILFKDTSEQCRHGNSFVVLQSIIGRLPPRRLQYWCRNILFSVHITHLHTSIHTTCKLQPFSFILNLNFGDLQFHWPHIESISDDMHPLISGKLASTPFVLHFRLVYSFPQTSSCKRPIVSTGFKNFQTNLTFKGAWTSYLQLLSQLLTLSILANLHPYVKYNKKKVTTKLF